MFRIMFVSLLAVSTLFVLPDTSEAGCIFRRRCNRVVVTRVATPIAVQKVVDVQFTPTFVSFVPSQVLLNGQVTTYGAPQSFGYSYQGAYQTAPAQAQVQTQQSGTSLEERVARIEELLLKLAGEPASTVAATSTSTTHGLFNHDCKGCHSKGGDGAAALTMFDETGALKKNLPRYKIYRSIQNGSMPKGKARIEDPKVLESVREWVHDGLEELEY